MEANKTRREILRYSAIAGGISLVPVSSAQETEDKEPNFTIVNNSNSKKIVNVKVIKRGKNRGNDTPNDNTENGRNLPSFNSSRSLGKASKDDKEKNFVFKGHLDVEEKGTYTLIINIPGNTVKEEIFLKEGGDLKKWSWQYTLWATMKC